MSGYPPEAAGRAPVRRIGRRRVATSDGPGVETEADPVSVRAPRAGGDGRDEDAGTSARDRWLLEQRPPHWG